MVLNMKLAMLLSLGFIGVMCWLVNQVARPGAESPAPGSLVMQAGGPIATPPIADLNRSRAPELAARFEQSSAAAPERIDRASRPAPETGGDRLALGGSLAPRPDEIESAPQQASQTAVAPDPTGRRPPTSAADSDFAAGGARNPRTPPAPAARAAGDAPPGDEDTPLTVTGRTEPVVRAPAERGSPGSESQRAAEQYKVARNDNLHKVARQIWGSAAPQDVRLLMDANPAVKKRDGRLLVGETIVIPARGGVALASAQSPAPRTTRRESPDRAPVRADERRGRDAASAGSAAAAPPPSGKTALAGTATAKNAPKAAGKAPAAERPAPRSYRVRKGDSLARIAERELNDRERWREISKLNRLANADHLLPGTTLKLPPPTRDG